MEPGFQSVRYRLHSLSSSTEGHLLSLAVCAQLGPMGALNNPEKRQKLEFSDKEV